MVFDVKMNEHERKVKTFIQIQWKQVYGWGIRTILHPVHRESHMACPVVDGKIVGMTANVDVVRAVAEQQTEEAKSEIKTLFPQNLS